MTAPLITLKRGEIRIAATLIGKCESIDAEVLCDSGFTGDFAIPLEIATKIGLDKAGEGSVMLADGSVVNVPLFLGYAQLGDRKYEVVYLVLPHTKEIVAGLGVLSQYQICFDVAASSVAITESKKGKRKYEPALSASSVMKELLGEWV